MRILYLSSVRIPSEKASGLAIVRQCQAFVQCGHTVELLRSARYRTAQDTIQAVYGIEPSFSIVDISSRAIYFLGKPGFYAMLMGEAMKMFRYFLKEKKTSDLIYSRDHRLLLPFVLFGYADKCFLELHTKHTDFITRYVAKRVKKLIVISRGLEQYYNSATGRTDIQIEPSGVDLEQFSNLPTPEKLKEKFKLPTDSLVFGYVGKYQTMGESKGVEEIIRAFALAYEQAKKIHLFLVGIEDNEKVEVMKIFDDCRLPVDTYTILPLDQKQFAEYLMASDVLLMNYPNTEHYAYYMSPTKLFAYLAAGKPIISSDLPSVRSIRSSGIRYVISDDVECLCESMVAGSENYEQCKQEADENPAMVEKYTWMNRTKRIIEGIEQDLI